MQHGGPQNGVRNDDFGPQNDHFGHAAGQYLARLAAASSCVTGPDGPLQLLTAAGPSQMWHGGPQNGVRNDDFGPQNDHFGHATDRYG